MQKKILFVTSALGGGGAERVLSILVLYFYSLKYHVEVVSLISPRSEYVNEKEIVNTFVGGSKNKVVKYVQRYTKLRKRIKEFHPDIIISFGAEINMYAILANLGFKIPIIVSERNNPYVSPKNKMIRKIRNLLYKKVDHIVFQTLDARNYFQNIKDDRCSIIVNPVSDNLPVYQVDFENKYVFSAGRLCIQKNFEMLIRAFAKLIQENLNYSLIIAGDGPERENLEKLIKELGISDYVHLIGFVNNVHEYMSKCSLFVLSSDYEGISNAMLEALAIGVPTICTDCPIGGAKMIIQNKENGILVPVRDVNALSVAMKEILTDKNFSLKLSHNAIKLRESLSVSYIVSLWEEIILKLTGGKL